jgi:hypothetical protein
MLGGPAGGEASAAGARELLDRAATWRQGIGGGEPAVPA